MESGLVTISPRAKSGTLLVLGLLLVFGVGWFIYRAAIPPTWLRAFGAEIALRAKPDPNAPLPEDTRQETPRGLATHAYICFANVVKDPAWTKLVFVTADQALRDQPILAQATWPAGLFDKFAGELDHDPRYQLVALVDNNTVVDAQLFYTFWAKLDAVARPEGYSPGDAIFLAEVKDGTYVLLPAPDAPSDICTRK